MIDPHFEGRSGFRHYSRLPDPWRPEDDSGRSPPQFCFSLSWLDSSSTAAPTSRLALISWSLAPAFYTRCW